MEGRDAAEQRRHCDDRSELAVAFTITPITPAKGVED